MSFLAALVLKTHASWKEVITHTVPVEGAQRNAPFEEQLATLTQQKAGLEQLHQLVDRWKNTLLEGDPTEVENPQTVQTIKRELLRQEDDRGRVWRECSLTSATPDSIQLSTVPAGVDPGSAPPNRITANSKLVAFKEMIVTEISSEWKVPVAFLGEFLVTAVDDTSVTLAPTTTIDPVRDTHQ